VDPLANWITFWKVMLVIGGALFFGIGVLVTIKGTQDVLKMFAGLQRTDIDHDR